MPCRRPCHFLSHCCCCLFVVYSACLPFTILAVLTSELSVLNLPSVLEALLFVCEVVSCPAVPPAPVSVLEALPSFLSCGLSHASGALGGREGGSNGL